MLTLLRSSRDDGGDLPGGGRLPLPPSPASMCRLATGRSALFHLIGRMQGLGARTVLMPCYVAEGVIQPFTARGFTIRFYRLRPDLTPQTEDLVALLQDVREVAVVILVHYFGFSPHTPELDDLLSRHDVVIVDDLAHAPFAVSQSGQPLARTAQIALFSLNKFLPVVDGAILVSNRPDIDITIDEKTLPELPLEVMEAYENHLRAAAQLVATDDPQSARAALARLAASYEIYYAHINSDLRPRRQSDRSRQIERTFPFERLIDRRRANSRILIEGLRNPDVHLLHERVPVDVVPFAIPARVPAHARAAIVAEMLERGVVLSTLQDKWDFVPPEAGKRFALEQDFLLEHVLVPVSEGIRSDQMHGLVASLNSAHAPGFKHELH